MRGENECEKPQLREERRNLVDVECRAPLTDDICVRTREEGGWRCAKLKEKPRAYKTRPYSFSNN